MSGHFEREKRSHCMAVGLNSERFSNLLLLRSLREWSTVLFQGKLAQPFRAISDYAAISGICGSKPGSSK